MPAITTIKLRRGTAAQWTSANPILAAGDMGIETETHTSKFGDGTLAWSALPYSVGDSSGIGTIQWSSVTEKPTEFPPEAHTHVKTEITDFAHTHIVEDITDWPTEFPPEAHTHVMNDITDLVFPPSTVLSDTAPESPVTGTRWINTTNFFEFVYYDSAWVEV
jgi:hypothetical protein